MTVTSTLARLRSRMSAASAPLNRVLTGTSTAPAWHRPSSRDDPPRAVRRPDGDAVARLDAGGDQPGAEGARLLEQLGVGELDVAVDDRDAVAEAARPRRRR